MMSRAARLAAPLALLVSVSPLRAQELPADARAHFDRGQELLSASAPNYEAACRELRLADELSDSWQVLGPLGRCNEALERDGEAIRAYSEYLAQGGGSIAAAERAAVEAALLGLRMNVAEVLLTASRPGLLVVDSRLGSSAPPQTYRLESGRLELAVRAGTHVITAGSGDATLEWEVTLVPGQSLEHHFEFPTSSPGAAPAAVMRREDTSASSTASTLRTTGLVVAGVGSAALVAGAVTGLLVLAREHDARARCREIPGGRSECPVSARDDFESAQSLATLTNVLLVSGGVLAATGVGALVLESARGPTAQVALSIDPGLGAPARTALLVSGAF